MVFDPTAIALSKKLSLRLDSTAISADQADFPLTVQLDSTNTLHVPIFDDLGVNKLKLSITQNAVQLPVEIENWGAAVDQYCVLLLQSDTTDGSTVFTDSSPTARTITLAAGTVHHEIDRHKFGATSMFFPGDSALTCASSADFAFGSGDFSIDFWINMNSLGGQYMLDIGSNGCALEYSGGLLFYNPTTGLSSPLCTTKPVFTLNTWYHVAYTRTSGTGRLFVDGILRASDIDARNYPTSTLTIGRHGGAGSYYCNAYIDELRVSKGIARWSADFTPPVAAYSLPKIATLHTKVPIYPALADSELVLSWDSAQDDNTGYVGVTGSTPAQSVWDSNFVFVSHQAQNPSGTAPQILDSTSYAKHGTSYGTMTGGDLIDGVTGKMLEYDGVNDYTNHGYTAAHNITTTLTLEVTFKPTTLLSSALVNDVGLISRQDDATDNADTFALIVNSAGLLHSDSQGGSIQGTTASWVAGTNFIVAATYNSTGLVGDLFKDGVKETLTTNSYNSMAGSATNNLVIGKNADTLEFFPGAIGEVRISKVVRSDDWIKLTHLSLTDALVTFAVALERPILSVLRQQYDLAAVILLSVLRQRYDVYQLFISNLLQTYGEDFISVLRQSYGDKDLLLSVLRQPYRDFHLMMNVLVQKYGDTNAFISVLRQAYDMRTALLSTLRQPYSLSQIVGVGVLRQTYDISQVDILISTLNQRYSMLPEINPVSAMPSAITLGGVNSGITKLSLLYDIESYCGVFNFTLASEVDWLSINDTDPISFVLNGLTHVGVVTSKSSQESHGDATFSVEARSPSVLLDYPYARKIPETFISAGSASTIMNDIAALEGMSVVWHLQSDPPQTSTTFEAAGEYPLQAIRKLVNELGGRINSYPDGTIHIIKRQPTNSDAYETAPVVSVLTTLMDFESMDTSSDQRSGWNLFEVSSDSVSKEYRLVMEDVSEGHKIVKAYKTPWTSASVELVTSELTNASITMAIPVNPTTEKVEELDVELVDGQGKVQQPCYGDVIFDYGTRVNLGAITIEEDGTVKSAIVGQTLVNLTYTTKYWKWDVYDTDSESAQFILFTVI